MIEGILASSLTPQEAQVQIAAITGAVTVVVSLLGILGAKRYTHPKTPKHDPDEVRPKSQTQLAAYTGEQNEFISLVIADSKALHAKYDRLDDALTEMRRERTQLIGAFARYINKLASAWGSGGKMPYPDTEDHALLEETLPVDWRRRTSR